LTAYEELLATADSENIIVREKPLRESNGRIKGNRIAIRRDIETTAEKACVLAEELGHYYTSTGDILDQSDIQNRKQELHARLWGYNDRIGLSGLLDAYLAGCQNRYEIAEYLEVTEEYLKEALDAYRRKYGEYAEVDNYILFFEPYLGVMKKWKEGI